MKATKHGGALVVGLALLAVLSECGGHEKSTYGVVSPPRDWTKHPAVVDMDGVPVLYALSDVHGGYDRMVALLAAHHVVSEVPATPEGARWSGASAVLVVVGDLLDKGPSPLEAIDVLRALEPQAEAAGGRVIFTLGNHEAEFFDDPGNEKASKSDGVDNEIRARGLAPVAVADGSDVHGAWLRDRPFAAKIGNWFFAHAGNTHGRSVAALEAALRTAVSDHDFHDEELVGAGSLLEARGWYSADPAIASTYAAALGASHIVFGHEPDALGPRGEIAVGLDGALFRIDCGMSPLVNDSKGKLLRVRRDGDVDIAESLDAEGSEREIWRGPAR